MNIAISEYSGDILFLHKLVPGPADRSYGVEVARLAGVPGPVVQRARAILANLERGRDMARKTVVSAVCLPGLDLPETRPAEELPLLHAAPPRAEHPVVELLRQIEPEELSPLDALKTLMEWKKLWGTQPGDEAPLEKSDTHGEGENGHD